MTKKSSKMGGETYKKATDEKKKMSVVSEESAAYAKTGTFRILYGGKASKYTISSGYGYFVRPFRKASNLKQISDVVDVGLSSKEVGQLIEYLEFKVPEIAKAASVSPSTVSRWAPETSIGSPGTNQFFKIDEVIKKGVELFGGPDEFKTWLQTPNLSLGNEVPAKLIASQIGVEQVNQALDALHFGNVI